MELRINPDGTLRYDGDFGRHVIRGDVLIIRIPNDSPERFRFSLRGDRLLLWETPHDDPIVLSARGRKPAPPKSGGPETIRAFATNERSRRSLIRRHSTFRPETFRAFGGGLIPSRRNAECFSFPSQR